VSQSPNILFILTDQQRADTIGALGNALIRTPVLDRLASEGTAFERAYTPSPVCVPARHAIVTGRSPHRTGVVDNTGDSPPADCSIMEILAGRGYQGHGVGKMHFTPHRDWRKAWGFETRDLSEECCLEDDYSAFLSRHGFGHVIDPHGLRSEYYYLPQPSQVPAHLHSTAWVADRSIDFLRRRDRSRPFFLWTSFIKPHPPFESPNPWNRLYRSPAMPAPFVPGDSTELQTFWNRFQNRYKYMDGGMQRHLQRTQRAAYYGAISFIDYHVGRLLEALGAEQDNTLVVFTSDHGELLGDYGCYGKRSMLDAAARVPLLVRQPGRFAAGQRCTTPVSLLDLFPTFAATAGAEPTVPGETSADLAGIAAGKGTRSHVLSQFSQGPLGLYLAVEHDWKYIYSAADRREWLFHVATDPRDVIDLSQDPACAVHRDRLRRHLLQRFEQDGYSSAVDQGTWRGYEQTLLSIDPDAGLLFQDPPPLAQELAALPGYGLPTAPNPGTHPDPLATKHGRAIPYFALRKKNGESGHDPVLP